MFCVLVKLLIQGFFWSLMWKSFRKNIKSWCSSNKSVAPASLKVLWSLLLLICPQNTEWDPLCSRTRCYWLSSDVPSDFAGCRQSMGHHFIKKSCLLGVIWAAWKLLVNPLRWLVAQPRWVYLHWSILKNSDSATVLHPKKQQNQPTHETSQA